VIRVTEMSMDQKTDTPPILQRVNPRKWRLVGAGALGLCALMAWHGTRNLSVVQPLWYLAAYWGIFLLSLLVAMYVVLLDIRYIRLVYRLGQRDIFQHTLGSEEFRRALREAHERENRPSS
jgi:hypothetical protein